nr:hypothetical protein B0A51_16740 [Rachicladosporium sp. CCFEE 5018]
MLAVSDSERDNRSSSSSDNTLPPIRSVFPPHILPSSGYTTLNRETLAAACPDAFRLRRAAIGQIDQAGRGSLSIRTVPIAPSLPSSTSAQFNASSASSTASPNVSECGSQLYTPLSSHHSSPEIRASVPAKRGSQDSGSSGRAKKRGSSDDERCSVIPCTDDVMCARHRKIRNEKDSRREQQTVNENVEDRLKLDFDHDSVKIQANGNREKSGLERSKQQNDNAWYSIGSRSSQWVRANCSPDQYKQYIQDMRSGIAEDQDQRDPVRALPIGDPMAGPRGDADICPHADATGHCTCADKITCRKQRRAKGYADFFAQQAHNSRSTAPAERPASSSRTPTSTRTPASSSSGSRQKGKL